MSKKIIRLTESELIKLVKKVIKEQHTTNQSSIGSVPQGYQQLLKPIGVKIANGNFLLNITHKKDWMMGCYFGGSYKGQTGFIEYRFDCKSKTLASLNLGKDAGISPQAKELLSNACGCQNYAKNNTTPNNQYV